MKKNYFKRLGITFLSLNLIFAGCSKKEAPEESLPNILKGTATINASTTQQTIDGFGGASILAWQADLTSAQRTKAFPQPMA